MEIDKDERYWEQRAKANWLKLGDKNTAFFHSLATQRRQKNNIRKLQNPNGREVKNLQEMVEIAKSYFQELFEAGEPSLYEHLLTGIERCITEEDNSRLTAQYTMDEIKEALTSMGTTKALGEDGFPTLFFQKYWHIFWGEVSTFCLQHLNGGIEVSPINTTYCAYS